MRNEVHKVVIGIETEDGLTLSTVDVWCAGSENNAMRMINNILDGAILTNNRPIYIEARIDGRMIYNGVFQPY